MTNLTELKSIIDLKHIEEAAQTLAGAIVETPFANSQTLSCNFGANIWLKFENLQCTGAYKERGALNRLAALSPKQKTGVIAMSAGNHAQGVAYHAGRHCIPTTIMMVYQQLL